jgi:hypothetical protein
MHRLVAGALAVAMVSGGIWAAQTWAAQKYRSISADTDEAVILADQLLHRAVTADDKASIGKLVDRRFSLTDRSGRSFTKAQFTLTPEWSASDDDLKVRRYGRLAVVTGSTGAETRPDAFFLHVWLKRRGGWRALAFHDTVPAAEAPARTADTAAAGACENPCKRIPYQPKTPAEQDIVTAFQAIESAVVDNDADAWAQHVADEFMVYRAYGRPGTKADRTAFIRARKDAGTPTRVGEVTAMQLWVFGDAAVMTASHAWPDDRLPPYRATRVWVRRDGRWQMALSQQSNIEP